MSLVIPIYVLCFLTILSLILRLINKKKREFIISMSFIVILSLYSYLFLKPELGLIFLLAVIASFIGDLLMARWIRITSHRTLDGILAFGIAHILYTIAFYSLSKPILARIYWLYLIWIIMILGLYLVIGYDNKLNKVNNIANFVYTVLITLLLIVVLRFILTEDNILAKITSLSGAILFLLSDGILAYNEFKSPIFHAKDIIIIFYIFAQLLLQLTPILLIKM